MVRFKSFWAVLIPLLKPNIFLSRNFWAAQKFLLRKYFWVSGGGSHAQLKNLSVPEQCKISEQWGRSLRLTSKGGNFTFKLRIFNESWSASMRSSQNIILGTINFVVVCEEQGRYHRCANWTLDLDNDQGFTAIKILWLNRRFFINYGPYNTVF